MKRYRLSIDITEHDIWPGENPGDDRHTPERALADFKTFAMAFFLSEPGTLAEKEARIDAWNPQCTEIDQ